MAIFSTRKCLSATTTFDFPMMWDRFQFFEEENIIQVVQSLPGGGSVFIKIKGIGANKRYFMGGLLLCLRSFFEGLILHNFLIRIIKVGACCKF